MPTLTLRALLCAATLLALAPGAAAEEGPRLWVASKDLEFDEVIHGAVVDVEVPVENRGDRPLELRQVKPSCGCTAAEFPGQIGPGERGVIKLTFDSSKRPAGHQSFRIAVYSNDPTQQDLGPECTLLNLRGEVRTLFRLAPFGVYFGEFIRGVAPASKTVTVRGTDDAREGFRLALAAPPPSFLEVEIESEAAAKAKLQVTLKADAPLGELDVRLVFATGVPKQPTLELQVNGLVNPRVVAPSAVHFGAIDRAAGAERAVALERRDGKAGIPVATVRADRALLEVSVQAVTGARAECTIRVRPDAPPGPFATTVWVLLDDPDQALVPIPVYGHVLPRVEAEPAVLLLAPADGAGVVGRVAVRLRGPGAVSRATLEDAAGLQARLADGVVELRAAGTVTVGANARLVIHTDVPGEERRAVPLVARP